MLATDSRPAAITEKDFSPPLKRRKVAVPGYWTLEEMAAEIGCSIRKIHYDITGRVAGNRPSILKAYKAGPTFLVADHEALPYIQKYKKSK
ncbi:MAG: hypothetical protein RLZZ490_2193 [Cyanobacteriota bacterium]|jgi:hypothetical protein